MSHLTFTMIKPNAVENGNTGEIIHQITQAGFEILAMKQTQLTEKEAAAFYSAHKGKSFFPELISFMSRSPIVAMVLKKTQAVEDFRQLIGATNPEQAQEGSIRKRFGKNVTENAIHGADSDENAQKEALFFFPRREIIGFLE